MKIEVPPPRAGKRYLMMELEGELVDKINAMIPNGSNETRLQHILEETLRAFLATQPIDFTLQ